MSNSVNFRLVEFERIARSLGYRADVLHIEPLGKSFFVVREYESEIGCYMPKDEMRYMDNETFATWVLSSFKQNHVQIVNSTVIERECEKITKHKQGIFQWAST